MEQKAYLILENGQVYTGETFGARGNISAELVFTTGMGSYLETITDPNYHGQIVLQTFPLIGNYGFIPEDTESESPHLSAYIVRELCRLPSNFRCQGQLEEYLQQKDIIGLAIKDTRALTRTLRNQGVMNAAIVDTLPEDMETFLAALAQVKNTNAVPAVTCQEIRTFNKTGKHHVVMLDMGHKRSLLQALADKDCKLTLMPADTTAEDILAIRPEGILISGGPGDPNENTAIIREIAKLMAADIPMMGIGLGHQLMALSQGASCVKLPYGHRGGSQAVRDTDSGKLYMTSQNHGFAVDSTDLGKTAKVRYENLNDHTCEGIEYLDIFAFSVQFAPEARGGSSDTTFLFDNFIRNMEYPLHLDKHNID